MISGMETQRTVNLRTPKRTHLAGLEIIAAYCLVLLALCRADQASQAATPGQRLWNIGSKNLFLSCTGTRHGPAVILESGRGRTSSDWSKVQPEIAAITEVCSYDRDGLARVARSALRLRMQRSSLTTSTACLASPTSNRVTYSSVTP